MILKVSGLISDGEFVAENQTGGVWILCEGFARVSCLIDFRT